MFPTPFLYDVTYVGPWSYIRPHNMRLGNLLCNFYFQFTNKLSISEDQPAPPALKKEILKSSWDDEDAEDNEVKDSWEDEDEPAPPPIVAVPVRRFPRRRMLRIVGSK
uniref:Uncharacterized protein n=1 Tax=Kalanchoe fedtschenkoi TaxID=63787 RepID=A0A7N0VCT4_KALFE